MPVRSLNSPVLKWPHRDEVKKALRRWIEKQIIKHPEIIQLGYFGSLAKDNWGVGSDLDLIVILQDSSIPFEKRPLAWDFDTLPVSTDILLYTMKEWQDMRKKGGRFVDTIEKEAVWLYPVQHRTSNDLK
jgi:predicted nucleotidyltransferase